MKVKIELKYPFTVNGKEYKEINIRRAKVRDQIAAQQDNLSEGAQELKLFSNLTEVPVEVIEEMDMSDYKSLQETFTGFLK